VESAFEKHKQALSKNIDEEFYKKKIFVKKFVAFFSTNLRNSSAKEIAFSASDLSKASEGIPLLPVPIQNQRL